MPDSTEHDERVLAALRLNMVSGIGPRIGRLMCETFGSPADALVADFEILCQVPGIGPKLARAIRNAPDSSAASLEWERCRKWGVRLILPDADDYPAMLAEICDPPNVLYCRGTLLPRDGLAVAIVGSRRCTLYGRRQAERLAGILARAGVTIVSGLARGIDAAAHRGAIAAGGRTIAVMATGLGTVYPPEHVELAEQVADQGALVSESPLGQLPVAGLFPQRNRIISGLSLGVVLIEASRRSGALHTARHAMEQGRDVFAVPGPIDSLASEGCHNLIRDGAILVRNADDILETLGPPVEPAHDEQGQTVHTPRELLLNEQERTVLNQVTTEPRHIDEVLRGTELESPRVLATLTVLEMKRLVQRLPGGYLIRSVN